MSLSCLVLSIVAVVFSSLVLSSCCLNQKVAQEATASPAKLPPSFKAIVLAHGLAQRVRNEQKKRSFAVCLSCLCPAWRMSFLVFSSSCPAWRMSFLVFSLSCLCPDFFCLALPCHAFSCVVFVLCLRCFRVCVVFVLPCLVISCFALPYLCLEKYVVDTLLGKVNRRYPNPSITNPNLTNPNPHPIPNLNPSPNLNPKHKTNPDPNPNQS